MSPAGPSPRHPPPPGGRRVVVAAAALAVALAAATAVSWVQWGSRAPGPQWDFVWAATGESFLVVGIVTWCRPGGVRVGALMYAIGASWFIVELTRTPPALAYTAGTFWGGLDQVLLGHLAVAFPSGRLRSRLDRLVVATGYAAYPVVRLARMLFVDPFPGLHRNLLVLRPDAWLDHLADTGGTLVSIVMTAVVLAVMVRHWRASTSVQRRTLLPVFCAFAPVVALAVVYSIVGASDFPPLLGLGVLALPAGFLAGFLRMHLDRAAVGRMVIELGETPGRRSLEDALARSVRDPSLTLAYWLPESGRYVDAGGRPVRLPEAGSERTATELRSGGEPVAALVHDVALAADPELIEAAATAARLTIENERLRARIQSQLQEVRASRVRIVEAADAERCRIERNLHDGAQQRLVTLSLVLTLIRARLRPGANPVLERRLAEAGVELGAAIDELREIARGIHPAVLSEAGLGPALEARALRCPLPVTISAAPSERLPAAVEATAYFVVDEALTNVARHARASAATVRVECANGQVAAEVVDDGRGGADPALGTGLQGIADRVGAMCGRLELVSPAGGGTRLSVVIQSDPEAR